MMLKSVSNKRVLFLGFGLSNQRKEAVSINTLKMKKALEEIGIHSSINNIGYEPGKEGVSSIFTMANIFLHYRKTLTKIINRIRKDNITHVYDSFVLPGVSVLFTLPLMKLLPKIIYIKEFHNNPGFSRTFSIETILRFFLNTRWQIVIIKKSFNNLVSSNSEVARRLGAIYLPASIEIRSLDRKLYTKGQLRICFLGHPLKKKGILQFPRLFTIIPEELKSKVSFNFAISSIGDEMKVVSILKQSALKNNIKVNFFGLVDPADFFRQNDILILPLTDEFSSSSSLNTVLEAMEAGCLVVTTNTSTTKAIIQNGSNGVLIKNISIEQILKALIMVIRNEVNRIEMVKKARSDIIKRYSPKAYRVSLKEIYA